MFAIFAKFISVINFIYFITFTLVAVACGRCVILTHCTVQEGTRRPAETQ
jgi:hypothetical protein